MPRQAPRLLTLLTWGLLAGIVVISAIAFVTSHLGWPIYLEVLSHFQMQYFVLCLIALTAIALTRNRTVFLLSLICVAALSTQLLPWYIPPKFLGHGDGNFRILIANINTRNQQYEKVKSFAQQEEPDLALFMEVNKTWINSLNEGLNTLPYSSSHDNPYHSGIALYSRFPLEETQLKNFSDESTPSVVGRFKAEGKTISFVAAHPLPPIGHRMFHSRNRQLDLVSQYLQTIDQPKLVIGDFNITMWSPYYRSFMRKTDLANARQGFGLLPSWPTQRTYGRIPSWASLLFSIPIDHCLLSRELQVTNIRVGPNIGSDHRPVIVDLRL